MVSQIKCGKLQEFEQKHCLKAKKKGVEGTKYISIWSEICHQGALPLPILAGVREEAGNMSGAETFFALCVPARSHPFSGLITHFSPGHWSITSSLDVQESALTSGLPSAPKSFLAWNAAFSSSGADQVSPEVNVTLLMSLSLGPIAVTRSVE